MTKTIQMSDETYEKIKEQLLEDEKPKEKKKINITIKSRLTGEIIFESEKTTLKEAVEYANLKCTNLKDANLENANLEGANLKDANLENANLKNANLEYANLEYANLENAKLEGAKLEYANTKFCIVNFSKEEYDQAKQFIEGLK